MWVTRLLQVDRDEPIRAAYIEFVATHPAARGRGMAKAVMQRTVDEIGRDYSLAALCPAVPDFYLRLGWSAWNGPLEIRENSGERTPTTDEEIMILWLGTGPGPDRTRTLSIEWRAGEVW
jgi:predicted GNAT family acetyltransferase